MKYSYTKPTQEIYHEADSAEYKKVITSDTQRIQIMKLSESQNINVLKRKNFFKKISNNITRLILEKNQIKLQNKGLWSDFLGKGTCKTCMVI